MSFDGWRQQAWDALEQLQQQWRGPVGSRPSSDSMGRSVHIGLGRLSAEWDNTISRIERVRLALNRSGPVAQGLIMTRLTGIDLGMIWGILVEACKDIALYYGGSVVAGTAVGGVAGFFAGGAGAVPGAMAGAAAGSQVGLWVLGFLGLKSLAEYMIDALPAAMRCYERGFKRAWGEAPRGNRPGTAGGAPQPPDVNQAATDFGNGHVIVILALLMGLVAYLTRGRGNKATILKEIEQSPRLGPKVAAWVQANEGKLLNNPSLNPRLRANRTPQNAASSSTSQSPSQLSGKPTAKPPAPAPAPAPAANSIRNASNAEKGVFGEAKADAHMMGGGFQKMNGAPVKVGDAPRGTGIDGVWRNTSPPPDYVITEAKYGTSRLATLKDGTKQMSDDWVDARLNKAVGPRQADRIREAMAEGRVEKRLLQVDEYGTVTSKILTD
ncbi:MAG: DUF6861 domain-containing protein [Aquabacterium sp.]|jgi:hypothetical protein|uniref:DUF6861 domain-containing protein n=1 Tax=Aquabacterium sp. TaxID=1872578 RepID=UPI003BB07601